MAARKNNLHNSGDVTSSMYFVKGTFRNMQYIIQVLTPMASGLEVTYNEEGILWQQFSPGKKKLLQRFHRPV